MSEHAILSPSSAQRWLNCTPSARLEQQFPDKAGVAAEEGTLAHSLGELLIRKSLKEVTKKQFEKLLAEIQKNSLYEPAMLGYAEDYATFVMEKFSEAQSHTKDAMIFLEQRLNLTDYVPDGFGTGDAGIIANHVLDIIDLKYGKGVVVSAENNKQMMLYALGWLREFDFLYSINVVRMTIYQPRIDNISTFEMSVEELKSWANNELIPKAQMAFDGVGEFLPGSHCKFCKIRATCRANSEYNMELAKYEFGDPALLRDEEISEILTRSELFYSWLSSVEQHALTEAVTNNKKWPGFKLVEGRSNRTYLDESLVADKLLKKGLSAEEIFTKKLLGSTAMEKVIGKADFTTVLGDLIIKPQGKPTLVPESDKRPELNSVEAAKADFAELIDN